VTAVAPLSRQGGASIGLLLLVSLLATEVRAAEADAALESYRDLTRVVPKRDCTASTNPEEITVCGRRRDNLRYRLPPSPPAPGTRSAQSVNGERFALQQYRAEGGSGSCTTVGPNGLFGCLTHQFRQSEEQSAGRTPGLIARALTYLDPDE
jgi:hypothetical protein